MRIFEETMSGDSLKSRCDIDCYFWSHMKYYPMVELDCFHMTWFLLTTPFSLCTIFWMFTTSMLAMFPSFYRNCNWLTDCLACNFDLYFFFFLREAVFLPFSRHLGLADEKISHVYYFEYIFSPFKGVLVLSVVDASFVIPSDHNRPFEWNKKGTKPTSFPGTVCQ